MILFEIPLKNQNNKNIPSLSIFQLEAKIISQSLIIDTTGNFEIQIKKSIFLS